MSKTREPSQAVPQINNNPLVSVITPTYNHERFVGACIESLLAQTYENWEQIVVDDGSTDRTAEVVRSYSDPRIKYIYQSNHGIEALAHTYNQALSASRGHLIAILEGDDMCPPNKLEKTVPAFDDPEVVLVYGEVQETTLEGTLVKLNNYSRVRRSLPCAILSNNPVGSAVPYMLTVQGHSLVAPASAVIRRRALESIGGFQYVPGLCLTDFPTFIMLAPEGKFAYIPDVLGYRRMHSSSVSFQYFTNISTTQKEYLFTLLNDQRFGLRDTDRDKIIGDWTVERRRTEFTHGRISLMKKEWKEARRHFLRALTPVKPRVSVAACAGWLLSWMHCDLEKVVAVTGRVPLKDKNAYE